MAPAYVIAADVPCTKGHGPGVGSPGAEVAKDAAGMELVELAAGSRATQGGHREGASGTRAGSEVPSAPTSVTREKAALVSVSVPW